MDLLPHIKGILAARTVEDAWQACTNPLQKLGFPHLAYLGHRLLGTRDQRIIDDELSLTTLPAPVLDLLIRHQLSVHLPMLNWITRNHGSETWDWLQRRRQQGRLRPAEAQCLDIMDRNGHGAGIAISLSDGVPRVRAGMLLIGADHLPQPEINRRWQAARPQVEMLTTVLHQRLSNLPYRNPVQTLTLRQREALEMTGIGLTTQEIAQRLRVTAGTVEKHLRLARKAMGARTTAQAVLLAVNRRQIFIDPGEACDHDRDATGPHRDQPWTYTEFRRPHGAAAITTLD